MSRRKGRKLDFLSNPVVRQTWEKCQADFWWFAKTLGVIFSKDEGLVYFDKPKKAQEDLAKLLPGVVPGESGYTYIKILKARQLGYSTIIAMYLFWRTYFFPGTRTAILAQQDEPAWDLLDSKYRIIYENLPEALKLPATEDNKSTLAWRDIRSGFDAWSASSGGFNAFVYDNLHLSEMALWKDLSGTMEKLMPAFTERGVAISETTSQGYGDYSDFWERDNEWHPLFVPWTSDPTYEKGGSPAADLNAEEIEYIRRWKLSRPKAAWFVFTLRQRFNSSMRMFNQNFPIHPSVAFAATGDQFFTVPSFRDVKYTPGVNQFARPGSSAVPGEREKYRVYTMGVDTASGSILGDYSSYCVLDVTDRRYNEVHIVETFCGKVGLNEFGPLVLDVARRYGAFVVIERTGGFGVQIINHLLSQNYTNQWREQSATSVNKKFINVDEFGWRTGSEGASGRGSRWVMLSRMKQFLARGWLRPVCSMLQSQCATFVFNEQGKPEAANKKVFSGKDHEGRKYDDLVDACALGLMGMDQVHSVDDEVLRVRPNSIAEKLQWSIASGKSWRDAESMEFYDEGYEEEGELLDMLLSIPGIEEVLDRH